MPTHLHRYDVAGHVHFWTISCYRRLGFFWHDELRRVVVEGLRILQRRFNVCLIAYVIMPDHVHVILYPHSRGDDEPIPISRLLHAFKQHVGHHGKVALRQVYQKEGQLWSDPLNAWALGSHAKQVIWSPRGYDFNIDRHDTLLEKIDYCHKNPIGRGMVESADQWVWSSFRFYEFQDPSVLSMGWDGGWPIIW